jgi:hypothetical protein
MALVKAVVAGIVAAVGVPYAMQGNTGQLGEWLQRGLVHFSLGNVELAWSWPLFCMVTLFAWGFLAWANR